MADQERKEFIKETIKYLNKLIKKGVYTPDINSILDILISEINKIEDIKERKETLEKLETLTIKCKKYKKYKTNHKSFSILEGKIEYEKLSRELFNLTYNYVFTILTRYKGLIYMDSIFKKYKNYLNVWDEDCNSLLYNLILHYLDKGDEYTLLCISYVLEVSDQDYSHDIKRVYKIINELKRNNQKFLRVKDLENILISYYPQSSKYKQTSKDASFLRRNNFSGEMFVHNRELIPSEYKDREDLLNEISFGITNSSFVENTYNVKILPNGNIEIYHNIADISTFLKTGSKIEKHAEKQIFFTPHKNHTGSLYPPEFLKNYVSLNPYDEKLSISVKHTFDEAGHYINSIAFRSVTYTGEVYKKNMVNAMIDENYDKDLNTFYKVMNNQRRKRGEFNYKSPSNILIDETNLLTSNYLNHLLKNKNTPAIYETTFDLREFNTYDEITKFTSKKMSYKTSEDFKNIFNRIKPIQREFSINETSGSTLKIDSPFRTFMDYKNLKNIDKLLRDGKLSRGALLSLKDELRALSVRASAVDLARKKY